MSTKPGPSRLRLSDWTLKGCLGQILTPQLFKQVNAARGREARPSRWGPHPLLMILLLVAWTTGDSQEERFQAARAAYVRLNPKRRRPGSTLPGFHAALKRLPVAVLRAAAAALRHHLLSLFGPGLYLHGFIPLGVDGSRLNCPFSDELHARTGQAAQEGGTCNLWVTAIVHLSTGLPLSWRLGKADASERGHLRHLLAEIPKDALLIADAGYQGFELASAMLTRGTDFLIRVSTQSTMYKVDGKAEAAAWRDGEVILWPKAWREQAPLRLRLIRVHSRERKVDVWLLTSVRDRGRLSYEAAAHLYALRWENEVFFRTLKRTLKGVKLTSRRVKLLHREAYAALLAAAVLVAVGALGLLRLAKARSAACSPRRVLRAVRSALAGDGDRRRRHTFALALRQAQRERRPRRTKKEKRRFPQRRRHKPPTPPDLLTLDDEIKSLVRIYFHVE